MAEIQTVNVMLIGADGTIFLQEEFTSPWTGWLRMFREPVTITEISVTTRRVQVDTTNSSRAAASADE